MRNKLVKTLSIFFVYVIQLSCFGTLTVNAQILGDTASIKLVKKGIDYIYDLQFDSANEYCNIISRLYPGHPVIFLYKGLMTYWENYPLLPSSPARTAYEEDMRSCISLCEADTDPGHYAENLLANLCARGMLLLFYDDNGLSGNVIPLAKGTYKYLRHSFRYTSVCSDFYYFTGLYMYYREAFPLMHPLYRSVAFLFPPGDMDVGLRELQTAGVNSILLRAESYSILSWIYLNYEINFKKALYYSKALNEHHPDNLLFKAMYIKNLLLVKQYDEAESVIKSDSKVISNSFYQAQLLVFNGILQEKKYHNYAVAEDYYKKGISDISVYGVYGNDYAAYAYFGLSRISGIKGDEHQKRMNRRKATELVDFRKVNFDE